MHITMEIIGAEAPIISLLRPIYFGSADDSTDCEELLEELVFEEIFADVLVAAWSTLLPTAETSLPIPLIVLQPENANIIAARIARKLSFFIFPLCYGSYKYLKLIGYILSCMINTLTDFRDILANAFNCIAAGYRENESSRDNSHNDLFHTAPPYLSIKDTVNLIC